MKNKILILFISINFFGFALQSCTSLKPFYDKSQQNWKTSNPPDTTKLKYSVFLIGDAGNPDKNRQEPVLKLLQSQLFPKDSTKLISDTTNTSNPKDLVIFLGDNIYETGLPEPEASDRKEKERRITEQMNVVKNIRGKKVFIPGNHDWNESRPGGLEALNREEQFVENYLNSGDVFIPSNGCGGPVELNLNGDLVVIILDSEWWLSKFDKPVAPDNDCTVSSRLEIIQQVQDIVTRNKGKNIVLAMHHPLFSNGRHGGYFTLKDYIFPLTLVRDNYYIPLPIIGSIYPLLRQYGVSRQDLSNKDYQQLRRGLLSILGDEKNIVIATGHEHALQFNKYKDINHVLSGAGSKSTSLIKGNGALFAYGGGGVKGFSRINYYENGQCWLEFWQPEGDGSTGKILYRTPLYAIPAKGAEKKAEQLISYKDSTKIITASEGYKAGKFKRNVFGEHYRDTWSKPIKVNYLDMNTFGGGLTPVKLGGGNQTTSLQLEGKDGHSYTFRTIDKDPSSKLPEGFLKTFAEDFVQDQISSAHPYGALIVPVMAKAIGIYHTDPKLVYMPYTTSLGPYIQQIGGKLGIIEVKPDENLTDLKSFGNVKQAVSTQKMYKEIKKDNDNQVDQQMFLKARLFDLLIGDWDRHEDQWRWAEFKNGKNTLYRPIPRDRDQAFVKFDGILPQIISKTVVHDVQSFESKISDPALLSIAARNLDRNLLNKLTRDDWKTIATGMQKALTDNVIDAAVHKMPMEVYNISGEEISAKLKSRRNQLADVADRYYKILAKEVTIAGSDKKEFFNVTRTSDSTIVKVFKIDKDQDINKLLYQRSFLNKETNEINLFALSGKDSITVQGNSSIKIRVIGGPGEDAVLTSNDGGRTMVYDDKNENNTIVPGNKTAIRTSTKPYVNDYATEYFTYDQKGKIPTLNYNGEDGIFLGAGYSSKHYSFRKEPFSYNQQIAGAYAPKTGAYYIRMFANFYSIFGKNNDLIFKAGYNGPKYTFNYYGEGNSTLNLDDDQNYYRVRTKNLSTSLFYQHRFSKTLQVGIGPGYEYYRIEKPANKFITSEQFPDKADIESPSNFGTLRSYANINFVDDNILPSSGLRWKNEANLFKGINATKDQFLQLKSEISFYGTPNLNIPFTFALRLGGATNIGSYKFFQANALGNNTYVRGFRNNRFSGRSYLFENAEVRFKLTNLRNYILTGNIGLFGFFDSGRVFSDNPEGKIWHNGYGPGLWVNLYNKFMVTGSYGMSKEGNYITVKSGFYF
ncbi:MAG: hypothetical protein JWN56_1671 [Sphingobacteriales bacterium]|nr:hypothetical protein [Sphingobacteriales bacterium]